MDFMNTFVRIIRGCCGNRMEGEEEKMNALMRIVQFGLGRLGQVVERRFFAGLDFGAGVFKNGCTPVVPANGKNHGVNKLEQPQEPMFEFTAEEAVEVEKLSVVEAVAPVEAEACAEVVETSRTTILEQAEYVQHSVFQCAGCGRSTHGCHMKAPLVSSRASRILSDEEIVASSRCKWCLIGGYTGWLAGTLRYAQLARANRVAEAVRLMKAELDGNGPNRVDKAFAIHERMIVPCSSAEIFDQDEAGRQLMSRIEEIRQARQREQRVSALDKRIRIIKIRILEGRLERAVNTLDAARTEFPDYDWADLQAEIDMVLAKAEAEADPLKHLQNQIVGVFKREDIDEMIIMIERGRNDFPNFDWDAFGDSLMNG